MMSFRTFSRLRDLESEACGFLGDLLKQVRSDPFGVILTGGKTPLPLYERLASNGIRATESTHILLSDERYVAPGDAAHNLTQLRPFLQSIGLPDDRLLAPDTRLPIEKAVAEFAGDIGDFLSRGAIEGGVLGVGSDGHIAGLFSAEVLAAAEGLDAVTVDRPDGLRGISLAPDVLRRAGRLRLLLGPDKGGVFHRLRSDPLSTVAGLALRDAADVEVWHATGL